MLIGFGFVGANKQKYNVDKQVQKINKVNSIVNILWLCRILVMIRRFVIENVGSTNMSTQ